MTSDEIKLKSALLMLRMDDLLTKALKTRSESDVYQVLPGQHAYTDKLTAANAAESDLRDFANDLIAKYTVLALALQAIADIRPVDVLGAGIERAWAEAHAALGKVEGLW